MDNFQKIEKIGEGTYGIVYKARDKVRVASQIKTIKRNQIETKQSETKK